MHFLERQVLFLFTDRGKVLKPEFIRAADPKELLCLIAGPETYGPPQFRVQAADQEHLAFIVDQVEGEVLDLGFLPHEFLAHGLQFPYFPLDVIIFMKKIG